MAEFLMSDFLSTETADYAYTLSIASQGTMPIDPIKNQVQYFTDDNKPAPISLDDASAYIVTLLWKTLSEANAEIIMELWSDSTKANGIERSFRWYNPVDTKTYVVNFYKKPRLNIFGGYDRRDIESVQLLVWGNYVP